MARIIKKPENTQEEEEAMQSKRQSLKRVKKLPLKYKFLIGLAIFIIFSILSATVILAQTGIVKVPLFSSVLYRVPMPTRVLDVPMDYQPDPEGIKVSGSQEEGLLNFAFGEKELTYILRRALTQRAGKFADNVQIVVTPDYIEFFGYQLQPYRVNLTIKVKPSVQNDVLKFDLVEYKIGNFKVPTLAIKPFLNKFLRTDSKSSEAISQIIQIKGFNLGDGRLDFIAKVEMESFLKILSLISESAQK